MRRRCPRRRTSPRRRRQVRLVRRLPAHAPRPRGRAARRRRALRDRRLPGGDLGALRRARTTSCSSRARSASRRTWSGSSSSGGGRATSSRSAPAPPPAASRRSATGRDHDAFRAARLRPPEWIHSLARSTPIAEHVTVDAELRGCPIDPGQLVELLTALTTGRRPQLPRRGGLHGVQAPRRRLRDGQQGHPLPRPGHPDRLRRHLPALRPRLLRLLRPARAGERGRARPPPPGGRRPAARGGRPALRRVHRLHRAVPDAWSPSSAARGPGRTGDGGRRGRDAGRQAHEHGTTKKVVDERALRGPRAHPRRGRGLAPPARPRRRGRRGAPRDLRDAALLRAARRRADARRGHRHGGPHLRDLPGRLPDERGPRVRGPLRRPHRPGRRARSAACSTAASGSRATPSTSTSSTRPDFLGYASAIAHGGRPPAARRAGARA